MVIVYVALIACLIFAHVLIYCLVRSGIAESRKPAPLSARQRRLVWRASFALQPESDAHYMSSKLGRSVLYFCQIISVTPYAGCCFDASHLAVLQALDRGLAAVLPGHRASHWANLA